MDFPRRTFTTSRNTTYSYIYLRSSSTTLSNSLEPGIRSEKDVGADKKDDAENENAAENAGDKLVKRSGSKSPILFLHGFPSIALDFYPQIEYLHNRGYDIVAPDLLGYGESSRGVNADAGAVETYNQKNVVQDLTEILDACNIDSVTGISHDFGAQLLTRLEFYHPSRVGRLIFLTIGPITIGQEFDLDAVNTMTRDIMGYEGFGYQDFLTRDPDATTLLAKHHSRFHELMFTADHELWKDYFGRIGGLKRWLLQSSTAAAAAAAAAENTTDTAQTRYVTTTTIDGYTQQLAEAHAKAFSVENGGYEGAKNWYLGFVNNTNMADDRTRSHELGIDMDSNNERTKNNNQNLDKSDDDNDNDNGNEGESATAPKQNYQISAGKKILLVSAGKDVIAPGKMQEAMTRGALQEPQSDLTVEEVGDAGHWVGLECPDRVNEIIGRWLG